MRTFTPKQCTSCAEEFLPRSGRQEFCDDCRPHGKATCEQCGERFNRTGGTRGRFCSSTCWGLSLRIDRSSKTCEGCGAEFIPKNLHQKFCKVGCPNRARRTRDLICAVCGEGFLGKTSKQQTCSHKCAGVLRRKPGKNNCERCGEPLPSWSPPHRRYCSMACRAEPVGTRHMVNGYMKIKTEDGWQREHRFVMSQQLGRPLHPYEQVHHKNGDKADNSPENLELRIGPHGIGATHAHCATCTCFDH